MGREFELKYRATPATQLAIRESFGNWRTISMETTYFDTPDGALAAKHVTLRLRKENNNCVCTMKTPLPDGSRGEWECCTSDLPEGLKTLQTLGAPDGLIQLAQQGVVAVCGAKFTRLAADVATADGMAELAIDSGVLLGGGKEIPLCEVEIEHKAGSDTSTIQLASILATKFGLEPESKSKFRRASDLAKGE